MSVRPWMILVAAGMGTRLALHTEGVPKQFVLHGGVPLYWHSAQVARHCACMAGLVFVFPAAYVDEERARIARLNALEPLGVEWRCVSGGERRQDSVRLGLEAVPLTCAHVLVHDAARPFAGAPLIQRVVQALEAGHEGVVPACGLVDTIKEVHNTVVVKTLDRARLYAVQTPQGFVRQTLYDAHVEAVRAQWHVTDDASLLEHYGRQVSVVEGCAGNVKVTHPQDMAFLQEGANSQRVQRTGFGYDVHRFVASSDRGSRPLKLGGVLMDGGLCVAAHSDGDVLLHALMDALLGCVGAGDIGVHFPDTEAVYANADSAALLQEVLLMVESKHAYLVHVDVTVITQKPKIGSQRKAIVKNLAHILHIPAECINVKATTEEGLGFTGSGAGIKVVALVSVAQQPVVLPNS